MMETISIYKPIRTCIICKKKGNKTDFFRITKINNEYILDINQNKDGRGTFICKNYRCIQLLSNKRIINKYFGNANIENIIKELLKLINE